MDAFGCVNPHASLPLASSVDPIHTRTCSTYKVSAVVSGVRVSHSGGRLQSQCRSLKCTFPSSRRPRVVRRNAPVRSELTVNPEFHDAPSYRTQTESELVPKARAVCFYAVTAIFVIPLFVVMVLVHPFIVLFDRHRRRLHHFIAKVWASLTVAPFFGIQVEGLENLPPNDVPAVYVSNHQSFLDIYSVLTLGRNLKFISKTAIFLIPVVGWAMYLMGTIPLRRMDSRSQLDCLKRCINLVKKGASVFFFPEGTRTKDGKLGPFKKGAFSVAAKTGVPVVPITLLGTGELMPAGMENTVNLGSVKIVVHKRITGSNPEQLCSEARNAIADTLLDHGYGVHGSS